MVQPSRTQASRTRSLHSSLTAMSRSLVSTGRASRTFQHSGSSFGYERPPLVLEWSETVGNTSPLVAVIRVGYAEKHQPQHVFPLSFDEESVIDEAKWYSILNPWLMRVWDQLMIPPSARRVVCVHPPYMPHAWETSIMQAFWNLGVPAVVLIENLETIPIALGWQRGMIVDVGLRDAHCISRVDGQSLKYTYQAIPCGYRMVSHEGLHVVDSEWSDAMDRLWLDEANPNSLMLGILKCLESCPIDVRKDVVSNLVFSGNSILLSPDLPNRVVTRLGELLKGEATPIQPRDDNGEVFAIVPVQWTALKPLANSVGATSTAPFRPDVVAWVGASLWSAIWHRHDDDDTFIKWTYGSANDQAS